MMDFESFVSTVKEVLPEQIKEVSELNGYNLSFDETVRVNRVVESIQLVNGSSTVCPSISFEQLYNNYISSGDIRVTLNDIVNSFSNAIQDGTYKKISEIRKTEDFISDDKIFLQVINSDSNKGLLEGCPHRDFGDLSIIYRSLVMKKNDGILSTIITNDVAKSIGKTEDELYSLAYENTKELFPVKLVSMRDMLIESMFPEGISEDDPMIDFMLPPEDVAPPMYVLTNSDNFFGASSILYTECIEELADRLDSDLIVLPSSIHEVIIVTKDDDSDLKTMSGMVNEINSGVVDEKDRLSNNVYLYTKGSLELKPALDDVPSISDNTEEISRKHVI